MSVFPPPSSTSLPSLPLPQISTNTVRRLLTTKRLLLFVVLLIVSAFITIILSFYGYIAWVLAHPTIDPLKSNPMLSAGLSFETIRFPSKTGKSMLNGWYIPTVSPSTKTIIFSHSYGGNREEPWMPMYKLASELHKREFNIIMFDYGYVKSDNRRVFTAGVKESQDLLGAIAYGKSRSAEEIIVWGFSMGAGTALQTALHTRDISAMILDSTFLATPDNMYHNIAQKISIPKQPSIWILNVIFPLLNGTGFNQVPYHDVLKKAYPMPIFFIHGLEDERSPNAMIQHFAKNQSTNPLSSLWLRAGAPHEQVYDVDPKNYMEKTMNFIAAVSL